LDPDFDFEHPSFSLTIRWSLYEFLFNLNVRLEFLFNLDVRLEFLFNLDVRLEFLFNLNVRLSSNVSKLTEINLRNPTINLTYDQIYVNLIQRFTVSFHSLNASIYVTPSF
jgi:hypothetical protein